MISETKPELGELLDAVIKESMRMRPTVPIGMRVPEEDWAMRRRRDIGRGRFIFRQENQQKCDDEGCRCEAAEKDIQGILFFLNKSNQCYGQWRRPEGDHEFNAEDKASMPPGRITIDQHVFRRQHRDVHRDSQ